MRSSSKLSVRLVPLAVLLLAAGCREAPRGITAADLQGDWVRIEEKATYGDIAYEDITRERNGSFLVRGDSVFNPFEAVHSGSGIDEFKTWRTFAPPDWSAWSLDGDTLVHAVGREPGRDVYVRLTASSQAPRPERIALRFGGCYGRCPVMDAEIDSSGTFWVLEGDDAEPLGRYVAHGQRALYDRLSTLAAGLRLDQPHPEVGSSLHNLSTLLVAWYGGEPDVFDGTADEFGPLLLVVAEMANAAWTLPMEETETRHHFASRDVLDYPFMSYPEVLREVFGEQQP